MILHLMTPFRTHLKMYDEEINYNPENYDMFWESVESRIKNRDYGFRKISLKHSSKNINPSRSRFRSVGDNSLLRPLEVISLVVDKDETAKIFAAAIEQLPADAEEGLQLIPESVVIKLFNNSVGILEFELRIEDNAIKENQPGESLDRIQETGIALGEKMAQSLYKEKTEPFLRDLVSLPRSSYLITAPLFEFENAKTAGIVTRGSSPDNYDIRVNWVTRSLLIEPGDKKNLPEIIDHWLKDSGDKSLVEEVKNDPGSCAYRWLNYLFRESSYTRSYHEDGSIDYEKSFNDVWEAMIISQYYYCAFEALNDSLHATLAEAFINHKNRQIKNKQSLRRLNRKLERDTIDAHETIIEYQNNFAYYNRNVAGHIKEIMELWDFETSILNQVKDKIELCEQRMELLHQKASAKSSLYTDLLLLSIAFISIIAFMFQVIEYGRNISHDAELAVYESNSLNLVNVLSERSTDFAISLSLGLIIIIFIVYYLFRKIQVLD